MSLSLADRFAEEGRHERFFFTAKAQRAQRAPRKSNSISFLFLGALCVLGALAVKLAGQHTRLTKAAP
jgi:hypothetical protein